VYDILGREITTLVNEVKTEGTHTIRWDGKNSAGQRVGSGVYFYQLKGGSGFTKTQKMILLN
jgi:flagellar hook assembly protein FlgD